MSFNALKHQGSAVRALRAAVAGERLPHALLFVGPRGVGKGLAARELAKLLLCGSPRGEGQDDLDPCDTCAHCRRVDRGTHPDLYWFEKEPDRNDFRISLVTRRNSHEAASPEMTVIESAMLHPMEASRTVTVLDDAEMLNREAANALLKVLEEPPPHAVLVLLCADAGRLPGTVLSRCHWVRFRPLPDAFVAEKVRDLLGGKASAEEIAYVSRFAGGSIERAHRLAGAGLWELKRELVTGLPEMDEAAAFDMAAAINVWARKRARAEKTTSESREETALRREAARTALAAAAAAFRDALAMAVAGEDAPALVNADQAGAIASLAEWGSEACVRAVGLLADAQAEIRRYVHTELATENALFQVSRLRAGFGVATVRGGAPV